MKKNILLPILCLLFLTPLLSQDLKYVTEIEGRKKSASPYSMAVWAGDVCYLAGQLGTDPISGKLPTDMQEEVHQTMKNLQAILKSQNLDFKNVVKTTIYLTDLKDFALMNDIYRSYFPAGNFPARETVQAAALVNGARIEISMTAFKKATTPKRRQK